MATKKKSSIGVYIVLGVVVVSLLGFGSTNLSLANNTLASVGDKEITTQEFGLELDQARQSLSAQYQTPISMAQMQASGIPQDVLSGMLNRRIMENAAADLGISAGDDAVRESVQANPLFQSRLTGQFDRDTYRNVVSQMGTREARYEDKVRDEVAGTLLQLGLVTGIEPATNFAKVRAEYLATRRDITWASLDESILMEPVAAPTDEELAAYHEAHAADFTRPETKVITVASLLPSDIAESLDFDDETLRALYDQRFDVYNTEERRLVERLPFADQAAAEEAKAAIDAGETTFDAIVTERGLTLDDIDLGDVSKRDLSNAGEAVFAAETGEVVGPIDTLVGPALFRMNAVLTADSVPFEEAREELRNEQALTQARRQIAEQAELITDELAGGVALQDLPESTDITVSTVEWTAEDTDGMAAYPEFREAAANGEIGDYPEVIALEDGGLFAMEITEVREPEVIPLDEARAEVEAAWMADATRNAIVEKGRELTGELANGASFEELGLSPQQDNNVTRRTFIDRTPQGFVQEVFATNIGEAFAVPYADGAVIARVDEEKAPEEGNADTEALMTTEAERAANGLAEDIFLITLRELEAKTEVDINDAAVSAVLTQFQ